MKDSIKNILRENIQQADINKIREYHDDDYDEDDENDSDGYFQARLPKEIKQRSKKYVGRGVVWYGDPDQMIVIAAGQVDGMWGNIYDERKMEYLQDLIKKTNHYGDKVELECSYGVGSVVSFINIKEEQTAVKNGDFESEYDGTTHASSTGDGDLDEYVGTENILDLSFMYNVSEEAIVEFFDRNRFSIIENRNNVQNLINEFKTLNPSDEEVEAFDEFLNYETRLKAAQDNGEGDFNTFRVQLRDGHHRVMGAIAAGERYVCLNLDKDGIKKFQGYYEKI